MKKDDDKKAQDALDLYTAHVKYWDDKLGLKNWVKLYESTYQPESAAVEVSFQERLATFSIGEDRPNTFTIPELARHEALELLMQDLEETAEVFYSEKYIRRMVHDAIHRLENVIPLPKDVEVKKK